MVAIVSHDAGGAEILSSWAKLSLESFCLVVEGPAKKIFERKLGVINCFPLEQALSIADWVLCGTSWQSDLEKEAINLAKEYNKKVVSFIDHWVNYHERFMLNEKLVMPNEIWVGDQDAKNLATEFFPNIQVTLKVNPYFIELKSEFEKISHDVKFDDQGIILYVCEPIREHALLKFGNERFWGFTEEEALIFFIENLSVLKDSIKEIRIRPHPSEQPEKYNWVHKKSKLNIVISDQKSLIEDIATANIIVGCESMAMVVGLQAGKRVISSIPPGGKVCGLPHSGIQHLQRLIREPLNTFLNV
jgi:hypothetical protein